MNNDRIINLWRSGLSKNKIAEIYKREYNNEIKLIRMSVRNRHEGKYISNYEALAKIEKTIYEYLRRNRSGIR